MPLQATSGAASYDAFGGGVPFVPTYIEDVMSVYLYTGNGSTQTITNGIDLSTKGGMVWTKPRSFADVHVINDTVRGAGYLIFPNQTSASSLYSGTLTSFNSNGFSLGSDTLAELINTSPRTYASWTFRKQPKFFDIVTYSGSNSNQTISHNLGSAPGCIMIKKLDSNTFDAGWAVYHRSLANPNNNYLVLNTTAATANYGAAFISSVSSTTFTVAGNAGAISLAGSTYVAYLFAHNAGGFGLTGTDNVISCGSYTGNGSATGPVVTLGYEPQWLMIKRTTGTANGNWVMLDVMRGFSVSTDNELYANLSAAEGSGLDLAEPQATGFQIKSGSSGVNANTDTYIYIAIRRGPMKVPTDATKVFQAITDTGDTVETSTATFPLDMQFNTFYDQSNATFNSHINDRLRGIGFAPTFTTTPHLTTASTAAETTTSTYLAFKGNGMDVTKDNGWGTWKAIFYNFRRAPSFFDEVCYTGNSTAGATQTHNLGVVPELMIVKGRSVNANWFAYTQTLGATKYLILNDTGGAGTLSSVWNDTAPTSTTFTLGNAGAVNSSGGTYVAYLFATCAGVSKCTAFTGTGTLQTINCGFTSGARFVLIKRTDSTGDWYVWDSSRGLSSSTDPYLLLNSTAAEVTSTNWVDTTSTGFQVTAASGNNVNINGASYIALAIA